MKTRKVKVLIADSTRKECISKCSSLHREGKQFRECLFGKEILIRQKRKKRRRSVIKRRKREAKYKCMTHNDCNKTLLLPLEPVAQCETGPCLSNLSVFVLTRCRNDVTCFQDAARSSVGCALSRRLITLQILRKSCNMI